MKIFITGASRGIGYKTMMMALERGHDVAFTYNNPNTDVAKIIAEAKKIAPNQLCKGYQLNVRYNEQVLDVVDSVLMDFDTIDVVVNNAGINRNNLAFSMTDEEWDDVIGTNLSGTFYVMRAFLPEFLSKRKGRFISLSSIAKDGLSGQANYAASKAGLIGLSRTIAKEYGSKGITSNVVAPGMFETDMVKENLSSALRGFWIQHCPTKRLGHLEEVAEVILFLGTDAASFVNGQTIEVNGGLDWAD
ncbi:MAG: SDR family oxidoreductase [Bacteroidetes bacterium]|nr:SDR family oxidoreductase [Bacteroidota bacterium]